MKLQATRLQITNTELTALSIALSMWIEGNKDITKDRFKALKELDFKLMTMVKDNTNTHYNISVKGSGDSIYKFEDFAIDNMINKLLKE